MPNPAPISEPDREVIEAIKRKLRHTICDHTGICVRPVEAMQWAIALEELAANFRVCAGCDSPDRHRTE